MLDFNTAPSQDVPRIGIDAEDIRERLRASSAGFLEWLFSGRAVISKHEGRIGNTAGEPGESLAVQLTGPKAGLWYDHATDESGDLIDLYRAYMGFQPGKDFALSLKEIAKDFLGDPIDLQRPVWRPTPQQRIEEKKAKLGTKPPSHALELGPPVESYGYYGRDGKVICVVRRYEPGGVDERGKPNKTFRASPGFPSPRPLYRIPQIIQAPSIILAEGERCADALASVGLEATTAMGGANTKIEAVDWSPLAGKSVTIWPDNDPRGVEYAHKAAKALLGIGCQVNVITPPADKPVKWDAHDCLAEGGDLHAIYNTARPYNPQQEEPPKPRIPILTVDDLLAMPPQQWVIDDWIPEDSLGFIYGDPSCGKSFFALDMCLHLAYGMPDWHGVKISRPGPVLYILQEGSRGTGDRIRAFKMKHDLVDNPAGFNVITMALTFLDSHCIEALVAAVQAQNKNYSTIVVDTVSRVLPGADENLQKEMTVFIHACDQLRRICGSSVAGVHHAGKSGDMRGSTVLRGAGDYVYKLEKDQGVKPITLTCEKLKDEENGWKRTLTLEKIQITEKQHDLDFNKQRSSLVIADVTSEEESAGQSLPPREVCQQILDALAEAWKSGNPWGWSGQQANFAPVLISSRFEIPRAVAKRLLESWTAHGIVSVERVDNHNKKRGYRPLKSLSEVQK